MPSVRGSCCNCPLTLPWVIWSICWPPWSSGSHSQENPSEAEVCQGLVETWLSMTGLCNLNTIYISSLPVHLSVLAQAEQMAEKVPLWQLTIKGLDGQSESLNQKNQRTAQAGRDLERSSGPTFCGKGTPGEIILHPVQSHPENLWWWGSTTSLGRLF